MKLPTTLLTATLAASMAHGAVNNLQVRGVTPTQAILVYRAPDANPCSVEVSGSPTYRPLVHDVDPLVFAGSNLDNRPETTGGGLQRVFVVGKRRAEKGLSGYWYSRALEAFTTHYYRVSCGSSQATGTFVTANMALGNTYNDALPADPAVSVRSYFSATGSYAWPEFVNWNGQDATARPEDVIDPQTGMRLKRLALPQDQPIVSLPAGGDHRFDSVLDPDGAWNLPSVVWSIANTKLVSIASGSGTATVSTSTSHQLQTGSLVTISGLPQAGNGTYEVTLVPSSTSFQISQGTLPGNTTLIDATLTVTAGAVNADDSTAASYTGTNSNVLFLRDRNFWTGTNLWETSLPTEYLTLGVKGWCSGNCAGEDAKIQACLTINGVSCWPNNATAKYQETSLGSSPPSVFATLGTGVPLLDAWTPAGVSPLSRADLSLRTGLVNVDGSGAVTWQPGGYPNTYFNANWVSGSRIKIAGSECRIAAMGGLTQLTINPASCSPLLSLPLTGVVFTGSEFGFLLRKKTNSTDRIDLQYAKYTSGTSQYVDFGADASVKFCSDTLTVNSVTGGLGYHCVIPGASDLLYWIDHTTGDATYLGPFSFPGVSGANGFAGGRCGITLRGTTPTAPETFYCGASDNEVPAKSVIVGCTLATTNQTGNQSVTCSNMTPGSTGRDLLSLITEFMAADEPAFDATKYSCSIAGLQGTKLVLGCGRSVQDTLGWTVVFDPDKVSTAAGCVGGGAAGCVVAAATTWATAPARWCTADTRLLSGKTDTLWITGQPFSGNSPAQSGDGPYTVSMVSASLSATPSIAAGTGVCPAGSAGCNLVTVDGEPCDSSPAPGEAAVGSVCPTNPAAVYLQDAKTGDVFAIDQEFVVLVAKSGNQWTLQRGYGTTSPSDHNGRTLYAECMARDFSHDVSKWAWTWDTARDPHGVNSDGTTVRVAWDYDRPVPGREATIGGSPAYDSNCQAGGGGCYAVRQGTGPMGDPPNRHISQAPTFAGATGTAAFIARAPNQPSRRQESVSIGEKQWLVDGRPLQAMVDISDAAISVSGQLYRLTTTTADGDNLSRVGNNIYVVKTAPATLVAAGNCSIANPCPIWNDSTLVEAIRGSCTITLNGGSGTTYVSRIASGGIGVTYTGGLSIATDGCPISVGAGFPSGSMPLWVWSATSGTWDANGSDSRGGASGTLGTINRKIQPTWAYCGMQPLIDASSGATGNVLRDTAADSYKYCVARKPGECRAAAQTGDIYVNCPNEVRRNDGSYGCMWYAQNEDLPVDICVGNMSAYLNSISQLGFGKNDFTGGLGRTLTKGLTRYKANDLNWSGQTLSDASWVLFPSKYTNGVWDDVLLGKLPPYPPADSVTRGTFQPLVVKLVAPPDLSVDNVVIQFGYAENGDPGQFFCTSRQENCLATTAAIQSVPFLFPSEGAGAVEAGVTGAACRNACSVAIPAISQRVLYYQVKYRDASNRIVATGQVETVAVP